MSENELLEDLARLARQQEDTSTPRDQDEAVLLQPLDQAARARIADRVLALMQAEAPAAPDAPAMDVEAAAQDEAGEAGAVRDAPGGRIIPFRRRWLLAVPALAAAAVLLLLLRPHDGLAPLPAFQMEVSGGRKAVRGSEEQAALRVGQGDRVTLVLRPATAVRGAVAARVFVVGPDGKGAGKGAPGVAPDITPTIAPEASPDGAIRITGLGPALAALPPGTYRLVVAVGRPDALPNAPPSGAAPADMWILERTVERVAP